MAYKRVEKVRQIVKALKSGKLLHQAIHEAGVRSEATIWYWRKQDPRIDKLIDQAQGLCEKKRIGMVIDANLKSALAGNVAAQCFFLKNKAGWKDVEPAQVNVYNQIWNGAIAKSNKVSDTGRLISA